LGEKFFKISKQVSKRFTYLLVA